jgi:serine/threonine protein phosphatase 1
MAVALNPRLRQHDLRYPKRLRLFHEIYIGHTPTINYGVSEPMKAASVWNVDTGAAFTGRLSALNIDTKRYFQSDVVRTLYPQEKGRNQH